jgi:hypothetical protein
VSTEPIIQKCFGITHWAAKRGRAKLENNEKEFERCDAAVNDLVQKLIKMIKDES